MNIKQMWIRFRADMRAYAAIRLPDVARHNGLAVEYMPDMPAAFPGYLDPHETPRFIAVNENLHPADRSYVIARAIGRYLQNQRVNSMVFNSPRKWKLLDEAPKRLKAEIRGLDLEMRTQMMMAVWGDPREGFAHMFRHPKQHIATTLWSPLSTIMFMQVRIHNLERKISKALPTFSKFFKKLLAS